MQWQTLFDHHAALPPPGEVLEPRTLPGHGGVYALADERGTLIQTVSTESIRRSVMFRLDPPADAPRRRRADLRAVARKLWWRETHSSFETALAYLHVARQLRPDRYQRELGFGPVWYARVDPMAKHPRWVIDRQAMRGTTVDVGPFVNRGAAARFVELLEDLFDLCRYHDVLAQAPHGRVCAYYDMGKCPGPCDGTISLERYRDMIAESVKLATGQRCDKIASLETRMRQAAATREFERAGRIKQTLTRARKVLGHDGRWSITPERFRYLIVQRAGGTTRLKPFIVLAGRIDEGGVVRLPEIPSIAADWIARSQRSVPQAGDATEQSEHIALVSHFLAKQERAPGLFLRSEDLTDEQTLVQRVVQRFARHRSAQVR